MTGQLRSTNSENLKSAGIVTASATIQSVLKGGGTYQVIPGSGNGSIGIDLTSKKDFMKQYLFFFENESIKVENSEKFCDFLKFFEIPLRFSYKVTKNVLVTL